MSDELKDALRRLSETGKRRKIARLRDIFEDLEVLRGRGIGVKEIIKVLNENDFEISYHVYINLTGRIRRERETLKPKKSEPSAIKSGSASPTIMASQLSGDNGLDEPAPKKDAKQLREELADRFINPLNTNPLFRKNKSDT